MDDAGVLVLDLDHFENRPVILVGGFLCRIGDALVGELHVFGGHLAELPPENLMPGFSLKAMVLPSTCSIDLRGIEFPFPGVGRFAAHQPVEDAAHDVVFRRGLAVGRIEDLDIAIGSRAQNRGILGTDDFR